ncbi:hypothetical protein AAII07_53665 [Microvirga sp. 0TCS3.31]
MTAATLAGPAPDRLGIEPKGSGHAADRGSGIMEAEELFISVMASCLYRQTALLHRREWDTRGVFNMRRLNLLPQDLMSSGTDRGVMLADNRLQCDAEVAQQVTAIGNMLGCGGTLANAFAIHLGPITGTNLHLGMVAQPCGHRRRLSVWQKIRDGVVLQIDDDGAVRSATAPRPLVDADHPGGSRRGRRTSAGDPQQGIRAEWDRQPLGQARTGFPAPYWKHSTAREPLILRSLIRRWTLPYSTGSVR